ncbi:TetR family transcriptional regulator [Actinoplanes sp. SE50]|uniref:mycofactocin system transcriptional regulator n=1 Tax=unclassified Actinoplanes TaxID=2626549 RepID=UPI00023EC16E|nr:MULTISPECIES: mycofactocin system transcriptional regulator [unclassified Actinoplanes]AEV86961.1 HTH-type transcriptional regulator tcmR [Actinoplanes sp. SE50/110]ATO85357.1 TetR family transcriptional regulator [Actinoplanes sp. SE50]SLM02769.1 TetR family transcriptional regulator [Actinoplanes sp. SE50/110]
MATHQDASAAKSRSGRPQITSRDHLEKVAFRLFAESGFDATTIDGISDAAGIGRRTFFRYFASKNDLVWGDFDGELAVFRAWFAAVPADRPMLDAIRHGVIAFNTYPAAQVALHRERMALILRVPSLRADSTLRFVQWRQVIADFVAARRGGRPDELYPVTIGHCALGAALAAYEVWLEDETADLPALLAESLRVLTGPHHHA